jgi:Ca2+-binding EF-hand superfamily protein
MSRWSKQTREVFSKCDRNKSGYINKAEYNLCSNINSPKWSDLAKKVDVNRDQLLSYQEVFNSIRLSDKHLFAMTAEDLNASEDSENAVPVDLDEKMGRIQFLFDKVMDNKHGGL